MTEARRTNSQSLFTPSETDLDLSMSNRRYAVPPHSVNHNDLRIELPTSPYAEDVQSPSAPPGTTRTAVYGHSFANNGPSPPTDVEVKQTSDLSDEAALAAMTHLNEEQSSLALLQVDLSASMRRRPQPPGGGGSRGPRRLRHIFSDGEIQEEGGEVPVAKSVASAAQDSPNPAAVTSTDTQEGAEIASPTSSSSADHDYGMESVLSKAAKITGFRLVWLLYFMLAVVIIMFIMLFVQITYSTNNTLQSLGEGAVQATASTKLNNIEMVYSGAKSLMDYVESLEPWKISTDSFSDPKLRYIFQESICYRITQSVITIAAFNITGEKQWELSCKGDGEDLLPDYMRPKVNSTAPLPTLDTVRLMQAGNGTLLAYRTMMSNYSSSSSSSSSDTGEPLYSVVAAVLDKRVLGRALFSNDIARYSDSTLQHVYSGYFLYDYDDSAMGYSKDKLNVALTSLTTEVPTYDVIQPSKIGEVLQKQFDKICYMGSPYIWHTVMRSGEAGADPWLTGSPTVKDDDSHTVIYNRTVVKIPNAYKVKGGTWNLLRRVSLCGVFCVHPDDTTCDRDNPSNVWFLVDFPVSQLGEEKIVTIVGSISIVAVIFFTIVTFLTYISITVPIHFLRSKLARIVGAKRKQNWFKRAMHRYTHRVWLGELIALVRAIHVLGICFRLNTKYVPDHILKLHAKNLAERGGHLDYLNLNSPSDDDDEESREADDIEGRNADASAFLHVDSHGPSTFLSPDVTQEFLASSFLMNDDGSLNVSQRRDFLERTDNSLPPSPSKATLRKDQAGGNGKGSKTRRLDKRVTDRGSLVDFRASTAIPVNGDGELAELGGATYQIPMTLLQRTPLSLRISEDCSILCLFINVAELAYVRSYEMAVSQHTRIVRLLLARIRAHKGVLYYRCGDCIAAAWNAFDSCPNHAELAAACAVNLGKVFLPLKDAGLQLGIALNRGRSICGTFEDNREAFSTVFGEMPKYTIRLAELAAIQHSFGIVATEPVKQALAGVYEFSIIDVIKMNDAVYPMTLFNMGEVRPVTSSPASDYAVQWAKLFSHFQMHEFQQAAVCLDYMQNRFPDRTQTQMFARIQIMCEYYSQHPEGIPRPYSRDFPTWKNYELTSLLGIRSDSGGKIQNPDSFEKSYNLPDVLAVYPKIEDDVQNFRKDLQDNVNRRLATPGVRNTSPHAAGSNGSFGAGSCSGQGSTQMGFSAHGSQAVIAGSSPHMKSVAVATASPSSQTIPVPRLMGEWSRVVGGTGSSTHWDPLTLGDSGAAPRVEMETTSGNEMDVLTSDDAEHHDDNEKETLQRQFSVTRTLLTLPPLTVTTGSGNPDTPNNGPIPLAETVNFANDSIIQSVGLSFRGETSSSTFALPQEMPTEILAKNGTTYLRSSRVLGKGSFGSVSLGMDVHSGKLVAIKFLPIPLDQEGMDVVESEVKILQLVKDIHIVEFISYAFQNDMIVIIMECMMAGSLQNMISSFQCLPSSTARMFIRDVLRGLSKLHSMNIIHRDVKPQNVLMSLAGSCKISDFGASAWIHQLARQEEGGVVHGTPVYLAPEAARGNPLKQSDLWSCGIMFIQLITGKLPYPDESLALPAAVLVYKIGSNEVTPIIPDDLDELDAEFVRVCLQQEPLERSTAQQLLQMPLFTV